MFSEIFIRRPRLAMVIAVVIVLAGAIALLNISVAQFPDITPPTVTISASYPGADAQTVADTVATPIEQQVNGVEGMVYMASTTSSSGLYSLTVTFAVGTDADIAQVNVQNRVALALPQLPSAVTRLGVNVRAQQPNFLLVISVFSPNGTHDGLFLSNYAQINVVNPLSRVAGVGSASQLGGLNYSMRIWLDPRHMAALGITPDDVNNAIQQQNVQAAAGIIGAPPIPSDQVLQYSITALGLLSSPDQFGDIILRTSASGGIVRVRDIARIELGAQSYNSISQLNGKPAATIAIYQEPGSNALGVAKAVEAELETLKSRFPSDVSYQVIYDSTKFVSATVHEIVVTLGFTGVIVLLVVFIFLQDWRATLIPAATIPVSLIGVFAVLLALGYSANTVTLFALILAIGLVVDDAIVVVENVQRILDESPGIGSPEATHKAMSQVTGPIVSTTLVLIAVFLPVAFLPGITGQLYRQFAVTITASVIISALNALTLSPALCAVLLRPPREARGPFRWFNLGLDRLRNGYSGVSGFLARRAILAGLVVVLVGGVAYFMFTRTPTAFIPTEDQGVLFVNVQLPDAASLPRTQAVLNQVGTIARGIDGVDNVITVSGFSLLTGAVQPNSGLALVVLKPWDQRTTPQTRLGGVYAGLSRAFASVTTANVIAFPPPAIPGVGVAEGFDFRLEALGGQSPEELAQVMRSFVVAAQQRPVDRLGLFDLLGRRAGPLPQYRSRPRPAPERPDLDHIRHAPGPARVELREQFQHRGAGLPGQSRGRPAVPPHPRRHPQPVRAQHDRRDGAGACLRDRWHHARADASRALQPIHRCDRERPGGGRCRYRPGHAGAYRRRQEDPARRLFLRMVRPLLPGGDRRRFDHRGLRASHHLWLPVPRRPIRELGHPVRGACLGGRRYSRRHPRHPRDRAGLEHLLPDRPRPAHRACRQERHPDRRVLEGKPRVRQEPRGCRHRGRPHALPCRAHDGDRLHPRLGAAGAGKRRRRGEPRLDWRHRRRRHARRDRRRHLHHSGPLCALRADRRPSRRTGADAGRARHRAQSGHVGAGERPSALFSHYSSGRNRPKIVRGEFAFWLAGDRMAEPDAAVIEALYQGVLETASFDSAIELLAQSFGCVSTALVSVDRLAPGASLMTSTGTFRSGLGVYFAEFAVLDPAPPAFARLPVGTASTTARILSAEDHRGAFACDFYRPNGLVETLGGNLFADRSRTALLGLHRGPGRPAFDDDDIAHVERLIPHVRRALQLRRAFAELDARTAGLAAAVDRLEAGVVLLDHEGRGDSSPTAPCRKSQEAATA